MLVWFLLKLIFGIIAFLIDLVPDVAMPDWLDNITTLLSDSMDVIYDFHNVVPLNAIGDAAVFLLATGLVAMHIRLVRMSISLGTGGGGSSVAGP